MTPQKLTSETIYQANMKKIIRSFLPSIGSASFSPNTAIHISANSGVVNIEEFNYSNALGKTQNTDNCFPTISTISSYIPHI